MQKKKTFNKTTAFWTWFSHFSATLVDNWIWYVPRQFMHCEFPVEITSSQWLRPDMTEKLLTGTLSLNTTNFVSQYLLKQSNTLHTHYDMLNL